MTVSRQPSAQIAALTRRVVRLPLPAIQPEHLSVVLETLAAAVEEVAAEHDTLVRHGSEAEISALVEARLCAYLLEPDTGTAQDEPALLWMWRQLARAIARGKESVGHDGKRIELRPDLNIFLTGQHPSFPLIVECKIIDLRGEKTVRMYFDNGVSRFLDGDYGWAAQEGVMLAYVRDGSRLHAKLAPLMEEDGGSTYAVVQPLERMPGPPAELARSIHARRFRYHGRTPPEDDPGSITLWHLWLPVLQDAA
jgi:hypothetical protein